MYKNVEVVDEYAWVYISYNYIPYTSSCLRTHYLLTSAIMPLAMHARKSYKKNESDKVKIPGLAACRPGGRARLGQGTGGIGRFRGAIWAGRRGGGWRYGQRDYTGCPARIDCESCY